MQYLFLTAIAYTFVLQAFLFTTKGPWPQWRGPGQDDLSSETGLLQSWPEGGPTKVWSFEDCGIGYSGPAIAADRLYILGSRGGKEMLLCLDATSGKEVWGIPFGDELENSWGNGPRGTPTIDDDLVYAVSGQGNLLCARIADGSLLWSKTMQEFGGEIPRWGYSESPLIYADKLVYTPGGEQGAIVALDKSTGDLLWQTEELTDQAHYSTIVTKEHAGRMIGVQLLVSQLVGFDLQSGDLLWTVPWDGHVAVVPTPVLWQDCVYVTSGYGAGCMLVRLNNADGAADGWSAEVVYDNKLMSNHHGGVILLGEHIYGHSNDKGWICQEIATGKKTWRERAALGKGAIAYADKRFYCLGEETGEVALIAASIAGWKEHGRFTLQPQSEQRSPRGRVWTHPVIAGGRLYLRDQEWLHCYDVQAE